MKAKLTFAQRLVKQSTSNQRKSSEKNSSMTKTVKSSQSHSPHQYLQFKEQHNQIQNMLKMFGTQKGINSPEVVPPSPIRNRLNEKNPINKISNIHPKQKILENLKDSNWEIKLPKSNQDSNLQPKDSYLPATEATITPSPKYKDSSGFTTKKKGIPNIGNTCYINALVQCLFHLPHFNGYFADEKYKIEKNGKSKDVTEIYRSLYMNVMRSNTQVDLSTLPLKKSVSKICSLFIDWEQQDAHEFMKELLSSMHEDLNRVKHKPKYKHMFKEVEGQTLQKMASAYWNYQKERDDSYIYDSLCGQTYNNINCINCGHQSECFQNFLDLSIPMVAGAKSLDDLLQDFFEPEKLSDYYLCGNCNKSSKKSTKTIQLWRVPKFLIIHLKRSQFGKKNVDPISVPQSLTLKQFMTLSNDKTAKFCQYSLCGIIMHRGVLEGGHYWCNVKQNGKWFEIDDDKVKQPNVHDFRNQLKNGSTNAYILFYSSLY